MASTVALHLFGGPFTVEDGCTRAVPEGSQRLVAHVALVGGWADRRGAAGLLWPTGSDARAVANLRSALWRLRRTGISVLDADGSAVWLRPGTVVDFDVALQWTDRIIDGQESPADLDAGNRPPIAPRLLPGAGDEWVERERELLRHRLLHGWEALARRLGTIGRVEEAVDAARCVIDADPLRESARRLLRDLQLTMNGRAGRASGFAVAT